MKCHIFFLLCFIPIISLDSKAMPSNFSYTLLNIKIIKDGIS